MDYHSTSMREGANLTLHGNFRYVGFDGYDKETGEAKGWSIARGADIWLLETCDSIKVGSKAWNKKTSLWLLRYVYIRNKSRLGIVYTVSAIWHGFYPGTLTRKGYELLPLFEIAVYSSSRL